MPELWLVCEGEKSSFRDLANGVRLFAGLTALP